MNSLRLAKHRFTLRFKSDTILPSFIGNTIRGALGRALYEDNSWFAEELQCACCCAELREYNSYTYGYCNNCAYGSIFKSSSVVSIPNPYTISVPYPAKMDYRSGDELMFFITLFGSACDFGTNVITAAKNMCKGKITDCVCDYEGTEYERVWSDGGAESIPYCGKLTINFITPTEILSSKKPVTEVPFAALIDTLFGRIGDIIDNYTNGKFIIPYKLIAHKPYITTKTKLRPTYFQTSGQPIRGFLGSVTYFGDVTHYLPYIDLGSQIHIGKKTTRACGEYNFEI
ncbi:MAG: CRISPR system precrRNA processing endoribonuclease RAMP protein Cas6 [Syntrophomonadaceae bacterium]|jgi:hypothetical protein|nr:CRISPR system precrRNA processing endoribonuclease RAMP protein Cas6 [Syntrophomonadaceae bacterium]